MSCIYGPVPSRRLGQSLGVDPIPFKTCNYNCVYCQLGRTTPLTNERKEYIESDVVLAELDLSLAGLEHGSVDHVTIVGEGEPLLNSALGRIVRGVKEITGLPVAVITNGSLLYRPAVREDVREADLLVPSLDAADPECFRSINRPWPSIRIEDVIAGLETFRKESAARMWIEVMLLRGLNDSVEALEPLARALERIGPDEVHLNLPVRPPAEPWVEGAGSEGLLRAMAILGDVAEIVPPDGGRFVLRRDVHPVAAVLQVIPRHPLLERDLVRALGGPESVRTHDVLGELAMHPRARRRVYRGEAFWTWADSVVGSSPSSRLTEDSGWG
ncbi:MAG: radical SAM protein [marine benthic group bacterium]|nr:radical SAM protein [Gemmatimonadota bacterium]